jgi:crotonobetainyl-CoA:carnitine CoA-transferase CaiB-like acyl-CoA transferase
MEKQLQDKAAPGSLAGIRVIEIGDEQGEYCGLVLAGLGAEVIRIEPPGGANTRAYGPFYKDEESPDRSLYFWANNRGKRSIILDLDEPGDRRRVEQLAAASDVVLDSMPGGYLDERGLGKDALRALNPDLVFARISPFGDKGPWKDWKATDLVHLALGGVVMNCGYDPDPEGKYDLPPVAPQAMHSYAIAGEQMAFSIIAALLHRRNGGEGQYLSCAIHEAVSKNTEADLMSWVLLRRPFHRQTCRHSAPTVSWHRSIVPTKDGRWIMALSRDARLLQPFMARYGLGDKVRDSDGADEADSRQLPGTEHGAASNMVVVEQLVRRWTYDEVPWREAQQMGLMWVPVRKPHESALDPHWHERGTFAEIDHPELGERIVYPARKWISTGPDWTPGRRAPLLDEDRAFVLDMVAAKAPPRRVPAAAKPATAKAKLSVHGKPMLLAGVRVLDFTWMLASAGATRFLASLGAEVIKVEWKDNLDPRRGGRPVGGRAARDAATGPVPSDWPADLGGPVGGQYNNKNPGKKGISLNVRTPRGLEMAKQLVLGADIVAEGFSPGVMERWGLGYDVLKAMKPDIIYAKQSGMGTQGLYGRFRSVGPVAQAFSGISDMSGLAEPFSPAGWGYSYLDWFGAYSFALAILNALYHRSVTGEGQSIDASQCEVGIFLTAVPILDWFANGRAWHRPGNHSPYRRAAPEGIYRCAGDDRWISISCREQAEWAALADVLGHPEWRAVPKFETLDLRVRHRAELDRLVNDATRGRDARELTEILQAAGVAAGIAQTAEDRYEVDPQLRSLNWLTELEADQLGRWPVAEASVKFEDTPTHAGGPLDRGAPSYGEHNHEVYGSLLGLSPQEVDRLAAEGVI